ncbi:GNAT family N-acetyltransferase [Radicibacter daui]|uniref:GNAT family N-acetyltransferase n=1 Tax=Radicibacter daui TaxID=3064829 RepID=UPI004046CB87
MITTGRLLLRPPGVADFEGMLEVWMNSPAPPARRSREEVWARLLRFIGHWQVFGYGPFMLVDRQAGVLVGEAGFMRFERGLGPDCDGAAEATWTVIAGRRGQGLASEAMRAVAVWFDAATGIERTITMIAQDNQPSLRIAAGLGFREWRRTVYGEAPVMLLERLPGIG